MRIKMLKAVVAGLVLSASGFANASLINISDFDGSEQLFDFNSETPTGTTPVTGAFTTDDFSIQSISDQYLLQSGGGSVLGTSGTAYNTYGNAGNGDATILFDSAVSMFGMKFGTSGQISLSATISAFDEYDNLLEQITFPDFNNTFVGFSSSIGIKSISIDRTDNTFYFTFIDDIRYLSMTNTQIPEPSTLAIFGLGIMGLSYRKSKK